MPVVLSSPLSAEYAVSMMPLMIAAAATTVNKTTAFLLSMFNLLLSLQAFVPRLELVRAWKATKAFFRIEPDSIPNSQSSL
jgi:hypothetical protein